MASSLLAINGGKPVLTSPWPRSHYFDQTDERRLLLALHQDNWSDGEQVREFERLFADFCGCRYAMLVVNGTMALKLALLAVGVEPGDEVIVPGLTWPSAVIAVIECGADPIPVDIDSRTYGLSSESVRAKITPRTKVIIPAHLFGSQTDLPPIFDLARQKNIHIIEDAAQVVGSRRFGKALGTFGATGIFSFNQKKVLACGEGGCLVTDDADLYKRAKALRKVELEPGVMPARLPTNYLVSDFQAAVLVTQLEKLPHILQLEEDHAEFLRARLNRIAGIEVLDRLPETNRQTFYSFCFKVKGIRDIAWFRRALSAELHLPVTSVYPPLSELTILDTTRDPRYQHIGKKLTTPLANCMQAHYTEAVRFHHSALTTDEAAMIAIETAVTKVLAAAV